MLENEAKKQNITTEQYLDLYMDMKIGTNMDSVKKLYGLSDNQINVMRGQLYSSSKETMEGELVLKNKLRSAIIQQLADSLYSQANIKKYIFHLNSLNA